MQLRPAVWLVLTVVGLTSQSGLAQGPSRFQRAAFSSIIDPAIDIVARRNVKHVSTVSLRHATGLVREIYDRCQSDFVPPAEPFLIQSLSPEALLGFGSADRSLAREWELPEAAGVALVFHYVNRLIDAFVRAPAFTATGAPSLADQAFLRTAMWRTGKLAMQIRSRAAIRDEDRTLSQTHDRRTDRRGPARASRIGSFRRRAGVVGKLPRDDQGRAKFSLIDGDV